RHVFLSLCILSQRVHFRHESYRRAAVTPACTGSDVVLSRYDRVSIAVAAARLICRFQRMAEFVLKTMRLWMAFYVHTLTLMNHRNRWLRPSLVVVTALIACVMTPIRASAQDTNKEDDKNGQRDSSRPPS